MIFLNSYIIAKKTHIKPTYIDIWLCAQDIASNINLIYYDKPIEDKFLFHLNRGLLIVVRLHYINFE